MIAAMGSVDEKGMQKEWEIAHMVIWGLG